MAKPAPDQLLLAWLAEMPLRHRDTLLSRYIFMTCSDSADLVLSGEEAWRYFVKQLLKPDFPLRRVARLLEARTILAFLLDILSTDSQEPTLAEGSAVALPSIDAAQFQRAAHHLRTLAAAELADEALQEWLLVLQGAK